MMALHPDEFSTLRLTVALASRAAASGAPHCSPRQKYGHNFDAGHSLVHFGPDYGLRLRGINENWTDYGLRLRGVGENWTDYALRLQGCAMATG